MAKTKKRKRPPVIEVLDKMHGVGIYADENLKHLHTAAWMLLWRCQQEMARRGLHSGLQLIRESDGACLSPMSTAQEPKAAEVPGQRQIQQ
jgi:hypothetical protein